MIAKSAQEESLRSQVLQASTANIAVAVSQWFVLVAFAKLFSPRELSVFVFALSVASPIFLLTSLKLRSVVVTDIHGDTPLNSYLVTRLMTSVLALVASLYLLLLVTDDGNWVVFLSIVSFKLCDSITELLHSYFQRIQQFGLVTKLKMWRSAIVIVSVIGVGLLTNSFVKCCIVLAAVYLLFSIIDVRIAAAFDSEFRLTKLCIRQAKLALNLVRRYGHLGIALIGGSIFVYAPNYALEHYHGLEVVGAFGAVSYFLIAGSVFISGLSQAATPRLARLISTWQFARFRRLVLRLAGIGILLGILGVTIAIVFGERLLSLLYNADVARLHYELVLITIVASIRYGYIFLGTALTAARVFVPQTVIHVTGALTVASAAYLLVPDFGTAGAVYAMLIGATAEALLFMMVYVSRFRKLADAS